jgi:hypothetical protein
MEDMVQSAAPHSAALALALALALEGGWTDSGYIFSWWILYIFSLVLQRDYIPQKDAVHSTVASFRFAAVKFIVRPNIHSISALP